MWERTVRMFSDDIKERDGSEHRKDDADPFHLNTS